MYQQMKQLDPKSYGQQAADVAKEIAAVEAYKAASQSVLKALGDQDDYITALQRNYIHNGEGDFKDYMNVLAKRAVAGDLQARQLFDLSTKTGEAIERTNQRRLTLQKQNEANEGLMQAAQTTNQYLDVLVSQNQSIQSLLAEQVKLLAEEKAKKAAETQADIARANDAAAREKQTTDGFKERWKVKK